MIDIFGSFLALRCLVGLRHDEIVGCEIMKTVTLTLLLEYVFTLLLFAGNLFSPVPSFEFQMWSCQRTKF